jgi:quinol monooxygenase YgiN
MLIAATNTVTIRAVPGQAEAVGVLLHEMIDSLRNSLGCLSYAAVQSHCEPTFWIVTGHWLTQSDMENHFHSPVQEKYACFLNCGSVRSIEFNSQLIT